MGKLEMVADTQAAIICTTSSTEHDELSYV
jgi:hypothetical protein